MGDRRRWFLLVYNLKKRMGSILEKIANCSCISSKANYPDPYTFDFDASTQLPRNK